jgi:hypothetical protein
MRLRAFHVALKLNNFQLQQTNHYDLSRKSGFENSFQHLLVVLRRVALEAGSFSVYSLWDFSEFVSDFGFRISGFSPALPPRARLVVTRAHRPNPNHRFPASARRAARCLRPLIQHLVAGGSAQRG